MDREPSFQNRVANFGRCRLPKATVSSLGQLDGIPAQALIKAVGNVVVWSGGFRRTGTPV
jgi:hypothetical protein